MEWKKIKVLCARWEGGWPRIMLDYSNLTERNNKFNKEKRKKYARVVFSSYYCVCIELLSTRKLVARMAVLFFFPRRSQKSKKFFEEKSDLKRFTSLLFTIVDARGGCCVYYYDYLRVRHLCTVRTMRYTAWLYFSDVGNLYTVTWGYDWAV